VRSCLLYCSPLWRPHLLKDIILLECVQRRATKFILNDYSSDYKSRLVKLGMLLLMYVYELADILFFIKSLRFPNSSFDFVTFSTNPTRSLGCKLLHKSTSTYLISNSRLPRLWNSLPVINASLPIQLIKKHLKSYFWLPTLI